MDSTLVTFLYKSRPDVRTVELFGSWDNFSRPYRMQSDALRGRGVWTGCHSFENIICDGDRVNQLRPRNGALKQGSVYYYYYRLDDAEEACDSATPTTMTCPFLPGQMVNILEVPIEVIEAPQRVCSASADLPTTMEMPMTTNPEDRYKKIYSKPPTKLPRYYCSSDALRERFAADSRLPKDLRSRDRPSSRGLRSIKRVRREEPEYQRPGACQIDVSMEDIQMLADVPDLDHSMNELPQLRPFGPCPVSPPNERPVTRAGLFTDFTKGLGFSFFGPLRQPKRETRESNEDVTIEFEDSPPQMPQYDGAFDEPQNDPTQWPLSPPMSELADEESWPLPPLNRFNSIHPQTPRHGPSTPTSAIPTLSLDNQTPSQIIQSQPLASPALSSSTTSDDYHPGFGPSKSIPGSFDMASPTFTADTLDSGTTTPDRFRLSLDTSKRIPTASDLGISNLSTGLEDLSTRLSALYTSSSTSSLFSTFSNSEPEASKKVDFLSFFPQAAAPLYLQNVHARRSRSSGNDYEKSNSSCLTLKPAKESSKETRPFTLCLPSCKGDWEGEDGFSSDVLGALGIA